MSGLLNPITPDYLNSLDEGKKTHKLVLSVDSETHFLVGQLSYQANQSMAEYLRSILIPKLKANALSFRRDHASLSLQERYLIALQSLKDLEQAMISERESR